MIRTDIKCMLYATTLMVYAVIGGLVSLSQFDYANADFVAYATIARRTIEMPANAVTAYWSSLFAWMMVPMFYFGIDELITGRVVLLASGAVYLSAIYRLTTIHFHGDRHSHQLIQIGTMTCAVVQAIIWANYLLAPDLMANAILYIYFCIVSQKRSRQHQSVGGMVAGVVAGFAYLAKAYMLPFCCAHFAISLLLNRIFDAPRVSLVKQVQSGLVTFGLFGLGLGLVAGPWIACLSQKCGRLTISTAGSSNHANMSPQNFRKDPLWNPGLNADYIFEPGLAPDWSAFQDTAHFQHQFSIVTYNFLNCVGLIPVWLAFFTGCSIAMLYWKIPISRDEGLCLSWIAMTVLVYCGGYSLVNLEARYIIPTVVPLLCYGSLLMLRSILNHLRQPRLDEHDAFLPPVPSDVRTRHLANTPNSPLAGLRLNAKENSTYLDLFPELPHRTSKRKMALEEAKRGVQQVHQLSEVPYPDTSLSHTVSGKSTTRMIPPSSSNRRVSSLSLRNQVTGQDQGHGHFSGQVARLFQAWPACSVVALILLLSGIDLHNLWRVTLYHPQATSMKQFRLIADRLNQLGIVDTPNACSNLHFGLYVAYASNRITNYWGAPRSLNEREMNAELAAKDVKVFLHVVRESEVAARPVDDHPLDDDVSWVKTATIRDQELLPNCLQVYVRR